MGVGSMSTMDLNNFKEVMDKDILKALDKIGVEADNSIKKSLKKGSIILRDEVIKNIKTILTKTSQKQREQSIAKYGRAIDKIKAGSVRKDRNGTGFYVVSGILRGDNTKQFYLKFAEYGTVKQSATPIFRPAMISKENEIEQAFMDSLIKDIEKEWSD